MDHLQVIREAWEAVSRGDLSALDAILAPNATHDGDGPWGHEGRPAVLESMRRNLDGLRGHVADLFGVGDRVIVALQLFPRRGVTWAFDDGVRYVVLTMRDRLIVEMRAFTERHTAVEYAAA